MKSKCKVRSCFRFFTRFDTHFVQAKATRISSLRCRYQYAWTNILRLSYLRSAHAYRFHPTHRYSQSWHHTSRSHSHTACWNTSTDWLRTELQPSNQNLLLTINWKSFRPISPRRQALRSLIYQWLSSSFVHTWKKLPQYFSSKFPLKLFYILDIRISVQMGPATMIILGEPWSTVT